MPSEADPSLYRNIPNLTKGILIPVQNKVTSVLNGDKAA